MAEHPDVTQPMFEELKRINEKKDLRITDEDLKSFQSLVNDHVGDYNFVKDYKNPESTILGERSFYHPKAEENSHNAWYVKCDIKGSDHGKLLNKRIGIKDNTAVANIPMMNGSAVMEGYTPEFDATVVQRILQHGGNIVGKTVCEDLCFSGASFFTKYGPVMNPLNKAHSAGGSSGGSGALVALGEVDMAIGGDQGGSVRIPASNCGIVGLKPTHGLVPYTGAVPICPAVDHLGPMTKNVSDCALFLECIAGYDNGFDCRQPPSLIVPEYSKLIYPHTKPSEKIKVAVLKEGVELCDESVREVFNKAVECLRKNEMLEVSKISFPRHVDAGKVFGPMVFAGAYGNMVQGCGYGTSIKGVQSHTLVDKLRTGFKEHSHELSPGMKLGVLLGEYVQETHGPYHYAKASTLLSHMTLQYNSLLEQYHVLIMPTLTKTPAVIPGAYVDLIEQCDRAFNMIENTGLFDATGHPALSLNCGFYKDLPVGLQIVGKHFDEVGVLNAASIFEESLSTLSKK